MKNKIHIFGCGIAGMLSALALANFGIKTSIIEIKSEKELANPEDPRTTAFSQTTKEFLQKNNIWESLESFTQEIKDIYVCQRMSDHILHMESSDQDLGIMISNVDLRRKLLELTQANTLITINYNSSYKNLITSESWAKFTLSCASKESEIKSDLCIAADGRFSDAKKLFFNNRTNKDYQQKAIVFNIEHTKNHEGGAIEHFLYRGPFATLPLKGGYSSSIVWSESTEIADFLILQNYDILEKLMTKFIGGSLGKIKIITKPVSFPLSAFITEKYFEGRLVLVADSAHGMHPLAGQALNMGIKDIACLVELIAKYNKLGLQPDQTLLRSYQKKRSFDNIAMVKITDSINSVFNTQIKPINKITELGLSIVNSMPILKHSLVDYAKGRR